jgi:AcrR family transcriptional regulator
MTFIIQRRYDPFMSTTRQPGRKELSHERIVETAARAIRRGGFAGVGVADIMKEAGLTHGGFYAHFPSRDALLVEAVERAGIESAKNALSSAQDARLQGISAFHKLVTGYLSEAHLKSAETGCAVAALASEMPRQSTEVRKAAAQSVRRMLDAVQQALPPGVEPEVASAIACQMVGALQLARALGANTEGKALLAAVRRQLLAQYDTRQR